jgi:Mycothiol maleylpyruvate isomerase N-terminal domain
MNAADVLKYGHGMVVRTVDGLAEADWLTPGVCGDWTVKDVVAHLAATELLIADVLSTFVGSGPTPHLDAFNRKDPRYNDEEVERRRDWSVARTLGEYNEAARRVLELGSRVLPEKVREPGTMPWYGKEYALDDFLVYTSYGHKAEHCAQIGIHRDRLKARGAGAR